MEIHNGFGSGATIGKLVFGVMVMLFFLLFCTGTLHAGQKQPSKNIQASPGKKVKIDKRDVPLSVGPPKVTRAEPKEVEIQIPRNGTDSKKTVLLKGVRLNLIESVRIIQKHARGIYVSMENPSPTEVTVKLWADRESKPSSIKVKYWLEIYSASGKRQVISEGVLRIKVKR